MAKVLVVGSAGREHALGWKLAQSEKVSRVIYAPGNGMPLGPKEECVDISATDFDALAQLIDSEKIDLTVVGPEQPLAKGIVDYFRGRGYNRIFGPTKEAAQLEADKFFSYDIMDVLGIPQAKGVKCHSLEEALSAIEQLCTEEGVVIKARGLTGGKGVAVCDTKEQALNEMRNHSSQYGKEVLISERLFGEEFSVFGISDGERVVPFDVSFQDHKRLREGDQGPNTGGMGAYGPAPVAGVDMVHMVAQNVMTPVVQKMKELHCEYKGFLYAGMMMTQDGPKVIEFNARFGDPECQPAMMLLKSDLYESLSLALDGRLGEVSLEFHSGAACCVVLASPGYPRQYGRGAIISGLENSVEGVTVFHAGTKKKGDEIVTNGGRVLGVTGYSPKGLLQAQQKAYQQVSMIKIPQGFHYRPDIGNKGLK